MKNLSSLTQDEMEKTISINQPAVGQAGTTSKLEKTSLASGSFTKINPPDIKPPSKTKRNLTLPLILVGVLVILIIGIVFFGFLPLKDVYGKAKSLADTGKELAGALKNQNLEEAKNKLPQTRQKLVDVESAWNKIYLLRLPILNNYYSDGVHSLKAASYGLDTLEISINTLEPYADLLGLKGKSTFTGGSADQRIQMAVQTLDKVTPKIAEIGEKIEKLSAEVDAIDPNRYPENFRGMQIRKNIVDGKNLLKETTGLFLNARPLLEVLPQLLGEPDQKRYLVIFQNDKELRPTGGFMTAYAIFKIQHGKFVVEKSDDIYELDGQIKVHKPAPEEIMTFHKGVYTYNIRDSNLSPDFKVSMQNFMDLYPNKWDFDGIIALDTHVLVEAIKILGDFDVAGRKFSAEIDKRCDCPQVIYELEDYATRPVAYVRETRKDIIGALMYEIMKRALGISPSQYWGRLFQMGLSEIEQKHILAFMMSEKAQKGIESLNMGGRIGEGLNVSGFNSESWDYLHINDANMAGAKSNLFMEHEIKQDYTVESDGSLVKTVTIDYKNPAAASNCNLEAGQLCLNGILRNWVRIYVPKGATLLENKGSQSPKDGSAQDMQVKEDLGKTVFEGFLTVRPQGSAQLTVKYKLPFKKSGNKLNLLYQKQPGTEGHENIISVGGKQKEQFNLTTDKVLSINL